MARFGLARTEKFGGQGGGGFFMMKNRTSAHIRFLYDSADDVEGYAVHEIVIGGKRRYVDCLCGENDSADKCPLCKAGNRANVRFFVPVYDEDADNVVIWDRGKTFGRRLEKLFEKHAEEAPLSATCFNVTKEINVEGFPYYTIEAAYFDGKDVYDLPEYDGRIYGKLVLVKTAEEMQNYLATGEI